MLPHHCHSKEDLLHAYLFDRFRFHVEFTHSFVHQIFIKSLSGPRTVLGTKDVGYGSSILQQSEKKKN